jgi:D-psicose/D-tagatose/L-ribulose 3-epimerase
VGLNRADGAKIENVPVGYRFATCNELFQQMPLADVCRLVSQLGYEGLEIAPFTLAEDPATIPSARRAEFRHTMSDQGLEFVGLHWLLTAPPGLQIVTNDVSVRTRSWHYVQLLIDLCADLATPNSRQRPVVVFGSPKQRTSVLGSSPAEAVTFFKEGMARTASYAEHRGVTLLIEALSPSQTDVVTSLAEAVSLVRQVGSPAVQTMFDVHNAVDETEPHTTLIDRYFPHIRHVHVNEMDGREPGMGDYNFLSLLSKLTELNYSGWVSLEAFDFSRNARDVAARAIETLKTAQSVASPIQTI